VASPVGTAWIAATPISTATSPPVAEEAPSATSRPTAIPTLTPEPTASRTPSPTPEPLPDVPLSSAGPWGLLLAWDGIWAVNQDGTGLTRLSPDVVWNGAVAAAPGKLAYITDTEIESDPPGQFYGFKGLTLRTLFLPDGGLETISDLQVRNVDASSTTELQWEAFEATRALFRQGLVWSPDCSRLAFVSGHGGTTSDLYLYSLGSRTITRLTDGSSHAYQLSWSPDGQYIFHTGVWSFGTGAGYTAAGVWVARADGTGVQLVYEPPERSPSEELVAWLSADTVLVSTTRAYLRQVSITSGAQQVLWAGSFKNVAHDPVSGAILVVLSKDRGDHEVPGLFLFPPGSHEPVQISTESYDTILSSTGLGGWYLWREGKGIDLVDAGGEISVLADTYPVRWWSGAHPVISGDRWAWTGRLAHWGVWIGQFGHAARNIFTTAAEGPTWSPNGAALFFIGSGDRRIYVAHQPDFVPIVVSETLQVLDPDMGDDARIVWVGSLPD